MLLSGQSYLLKRQRRFITRLTLCVCVGGGEATTRSFETSDKIEVLPLMAKINRSLMGATYCTKRHPMLYTAAVAADCDLY